MTKENYQKLSEQDKRNYVQCGQCGEWVFMGSLDEVLFHEDHVPRPDIQYSGSAKVE
jgi:hypothetical protein